jgi:hypothetical protein
MGVSTSDPHASRILVCLNKESLVETSLDAFLIRLASSEQNFNVTAAVSVRNCTCFVRGHQR